MRALVWFAGCVGLYFLADRLHLWRPMLDYTVILFIWCWVFVGAFFVSKGSAPGRAPWRASDADVEGLRAAAEKAAQKTERERGGPTP